MGSHGPLRLIVKKNKTNNHSILITNTYRLAAVDEDKADGQPKSLQNERSREVRRTGGFKRLLMP